MSGHHSIVFAVIYQAEWVFPKTGVSSFIKLQLLCFSTVLQLVKIVILKSPAHLYIPETKQIQHGVIAQFLLPPFVLIWNHFRWCQQKVSQKNPQTRFSVCPLILGFVTTYVTQEWPGERTEGGCFYIKNNVMTRIVFLFQLEQKVIHCNCRWHYELLLTYLSCTH